MKEQDVVAYKQNGLQESQMLSICLFFAASECKQQIMSKGQTLETNMCICFHALHSQLIKCNAIKCCMLVVWSLASCSKEMNVST